MGSYCAYMAWSAGRFIFNATPAMAIAGGISIVMLWKAVGSAEFVEHGEERNQYTGARISQLVVPRASPMVKRILSILACRISAYDLWFDSAILG